MEVNSRNVQDIIAKLRRLADRLESGRYLLLSSATRSTTNPPDGHSVPTTRVEGLEEGNYVSQQRSWDIEWLEPDVKV